MDPDERLDLILGIVSELSSTDSVVLVEGRNDIRALNALGADVICSQHKLRYNLPTGA